MFRRKKLRQELLKYRQAVANKLKIRDWLNNLFGEGKQDAYVLGDTASCFLNKRKSNSLHNKNEMGVCNYYEKKKQNADSYYNGHGAFERMRYAR